MAARGEPEEEFIDLYLGLFSLETVGRSLVSGADYQAIYGLGSLRGRRPSSSPPTATTASAARDLCAGASSTASSLSRTTRRSLFKDTDYRRLDAFAAQGSPRFKEIGLFRLPEAAKFDPAKPFRLELLVQRPIGPIEKAFTSFSLAYELPSKFVTTEQTTTAPTPPQAKR